MTGQGSPRSSRASRARWIEDRYCSIRCLLVAMFFSCAAISVAAEPTNMRVRVALGGGTPQKWQGTISVSRGSLSELRRLGTEADEARSIWIDGDRIRLDQPSARDYDGFDMLVTAPLESKLILRLAAGEAKPRLIEIPLSKLLGEHHNSALDQKGNWLLVRRTPGDSLRVRLEHDSLVFAPGDVLKMEIEPNLLGVRPGTNVQIRSELFVGRTAQQKWKQDNNLRLAADPKSNVFPLEVPLSQKEGVYTLSIVATTRNRFGWPKTLARRKVQLVVLDFDGPGPPEKSQSSFSQVIQIHRADQKWWERLKKLPGIPGSKAVIGSGQSKIHKHSLGTLISLEPGGWEAYELKRCRPGMPHVLEIEYPSDVPQTLGISIIEPNAAGEIVPIGLDSGLFVPEGIEKVTPRMLRHRLIFWPRTKQPYVLLTARDQRHPALFGKIRVLATPGRLAMAKPATDRSQGRLFAAYFDKPLLPENFSASESLDEWSGRSLEDWQTFYQAGLRLVEYLDHVGYNGLMLSVLADGSTIYPSELLEPTPKFDKGAFFSTGQDPVRKDVLEMLLRLFDRRGLRLIPMLEFSAPLPELEKILRGGGPESVGIQWVGADGRTWLETHSTQRNQAPYYNPLNPRVQSAMLAVVRELAKRYGSHRSFAGLALGLSGYGYAQLPGPDWGYDDVTIARFERETGMKVPGQGPGRFAERARFLSGKKRLWLQWRARTLAQFHHLLREEVARVRPGAKLFLAGAKMFDGPYSQSQLLPTLPRRVKIDHALIDLGIHPEFYRQFKHIVLVRPGRIAPQGIVPAKGADLRINYSTTLDKLYAEGSTPSSLFYHRPQPRRLDAFSEKSPFGKSKTFTLLMSQITPAGDYNRQRFVHALAAMDVQMMFDGGWLLSMGQEEALSEMVSVYRRLPATRFETVGGESQPVTIRTSTQGQQTYAYLVNDSPWKLSINLRVQLPGDLPQNVRVESLSSTRPVAPLTLRGGQADWSVQMEPYELVGVQFSAPQVKLAQPQVFFSSDARKLLDQAITSLGRRSSALRSPKPIEVLNNPGFDQAEHGKIAGWETATNPLRTEVRLDPRVKHLGTQSVVMRSKGPAMWLRSLPFDPPKTGRLSVSVWLRVEDPAEQPLLRLAVEGKLNGQLYYRFAPVGLGKGVQPIKNKWSQYIVKFDDLPARGLSDLRVRFDLMQAGEVWIDEVQLYDLAFSDNERLELSKIISLASIQLQKGKVGDCTRLLECYWPRFLVAHVPLPEPESNSKPRKSKAAEPGPPAEPKKKPGWLDNVKEWFRF